MRRNTAHEQIHVRCNMDEPIEMLVDKLSTKSSDLYIFWQNYNNLYRQYNEKVNQNNKLKEELEYVKKNAIKNVNQTRMHQEQAYLKDRLKAAENNCETLRTQNQKLKTSNKELKMEITRITEEVNHMQLLINQLREENSNQRNSIANILQKLKVAQAQLANYTKSCDQLQEKQALLARMLEKEKEMQIILEEKDQEIDQLTKANKETKVKYQKILREAMQSAKQSVINSLPPAYAHKMERGGF